MEIEKWDKGQMITSVKDESTGGISGWPATDYLNIFVCNIRNLRGYATFPDAKTMAWK